MPCPVSGPAWGDSQGPGTARSSFPQADLVNDLGNKGYLVFGLILFVWELLPTTLLVGFFRVHRPPQDLVRPHGRAGVAGRGAAGGAGTVRLCRAPAAP